MLIFAGVCTKRENIMHLPSIRSGTTFAIGVYGRVEKSSRFKSISFGNISLKRSLLKNWCNVLEFLILL